jgi:hypothetical protein
MNNFSMPCAVAAITTGHILSGAELPLTGTLTSPYLTLAYLPTQLTS